MPLILVTGLPCSGKSTTAKKIFDHIETKLEQEGDHRQVKLVTDTDNLDWDGRNIIYMSIAKEKELRAWLKCEAQRYMNLNQIVIIDAAAYIKGYRYELFCISKEAKTQYCVVEKLIDPEICWKLNEKRQAGTEVQNNDDDESPELHYSRETFDALVMRYEKCDEKNRWDSPLFRVVSDEDKLDLDLIYDIITKGDPLVPNKCTSLTTTTTTIFKPAR